MFPHPLGYYGTLGSVWLAYAASQTWFKIFAATAALSCGRNGPPGFVELGRVV